jgi:hypothetical protein
MFAFGIWDSARHELFLCRDRFGVKPLYYVHTDDGALYFASEIKALLAAEAVRPALNEAALPDFLANHATSDDQTLFAGVRRLPPGHTLTWRDGRIGIRRYWDLHFAPEAEADPRSDADAGRLAQGAAGDEFADEGADERAEQQARQAEEQAEQGAERSAYHRVATRADLLRAEDAGDEVDAEREHGERTEHEQREHARMREAVGPRREQQSAEQERYARQRGQHGADEADDDEDDGEDVPEGVEIHSAIRFGDAVTLADTGLDRERPA